MTQSRPGGAARLHTPKKKKKRKITLHPLLSDDSKQNQSNEDGVRGRKKRRREGGERVFSVSVTSMTQIFQNLLPGRKLACLKFNGRRTDMHKSKIRRYPCVKQQT